MDEKIAVVVGNGMVGQRFVESLRERDASRSWRVTVLAEESRRAYDRVALSSYVDGVGADALDLVADGCYDGGHYALHLGEAAVGVDRAARTVTTGTGRVLPYDALVLATGSAAFVPPVPGATGPGRFVYRTLDDLDAIRAAAERAVARRGDVGRGGEARGVVVGGGLLGLEAARALRLLGLAPTIVEFAPRLMPMQLDEGGGALLRQFVEELDVTLHLGTGLASIVDGEPLTVTLSDETVIAADVVVFAAGVRPRDELARAAGLDIGPRGGVVVDSGCATTDANVYAIGECACVEGRVYGLVGPGYAMATVLADRLTGGDATLATPDTATTLKLLGVDVASFGDANAVSPGALEVVVNDPVGRTYAKLVVSDDASMLLGGVLVGDTSRYASLRPLVGRALPGDPLTMIAPSGGEAPTGGVAGLPDDAMVCSCHLVTKGALCGAISAGGLAGVADVKAATKAGTGCGSCVSSIKALLAASGAAAETGLCEHFSQSRVELFELVSSGQARTFSELVSRFGTGRGCDICKPAVASILASLSADLGTGHILDGEQAALQDTNDHFLANMQRNGTYSVVPRVPGGEITPAKLIALGEVARDFNLYTKITGGQRIDLFGVRTEQLPAVWRRLVDAGFESGHAYGKALRTVKSCVGDTWCRYGMRDSVGLAIELELRYRGIRAPHKIKAGVSGCARECAEAQSKDIGVIATEGGWNLYVGGNGGFRPRHADLLLTGVDTETLIRTIDRFIIFYIRSADRLQRTAAWVESLSTDGQDGLAYLRSVLVEDSLGIAAELDAAMARHVERYSDEWAAVLADPERLRRFVSFVNAPDTADPAISFVTERGQIRPAPAAGPVPITITRQPVAIDRVPGTDRQGAVSR